MTVMAAVTVFAAIAFGSALSIWQRTVQANTQLEIANEANGFLERMLSSVQPRYALGEEITLREFIDQAAAELEQDPPSRPEVEASVRRTLGQTYAVVGRRDLAQPQMRRTFELLRETLGAGDERTLADLNRYIGNTIQLGTWMMRRSSSQRRSSRPRARSTRTIRRPSRPSSTTPRSCRRGAATTKWNTSSNAP